MFSDLLWVLTACHSWMTLTSTLRYSSNTIITLSCIIRDLKCQRVLQKWLNISTENIGDSPPTAISCGHRRAINRPANTNGVFSDLSGNHLIKDGYQRSEHNSNERYYPFFCQWFQAWAAECFCVSFPGDKWAIDFLSQCMHILLLFIYRFPWESAYQKECSLGN